MDCAGDGLRMDVMVKSGGLYGVEIWGCKRCEELERAQEHSQINLSDNLSYVSLFSYKIQFIKFG